MRSHSPSPPRSRRVLPFLLCLCSYLALVSATPVDLRSFPAIADNFPYAATLEKRQQATAGNDTSLSSSKNGGTGSANQAAQAAGSSINTGAGGNRAAPTSQSQFAELLSPFFFGCLLNLFFGGALLVQAWHYFERFGRRGSDQPILQLLVATLLALSLISNAVLIHRLYEVHVANFGSFAFPLLTIGTETSVNYAINASMSALVQCYFAHRVLVAQRNRWLMLPFIPLILYTFCGGVATAVLALQSGSAANIVGTALRSFQPQSKPWQWSVCFATWLCAAAAVDVGLCTMLMAQLLRMRSQFWGTRYAIARLLLLSMETCLITSSFALCSMILFLSKPQSQDFYITFAPIGQLQAASLVVTLMARPSIARQMNVGDGRLESQFNEVNSSPVTLAKPVMKRILRNEERKRPKADPSQIQITTHIQQVDVEDELSDFAREYLRGNAAAILPAVVDGKEGSATTDASDDRSVDGTTRILSRKPSREAFGQRIPGSAGLGDDAEKTMFSTSDATVTHNEDDAKARGTPGAAATQRGSADLDALSGMTPEQRQQQSEERQEQRQQQQLQKQTLQALVGSGIGAPASGGGSSSSGGSGLTGILNTLGGGGSSTPNNNGASADGNQSKMGRTPRGRLVRIA